LENRVPVRSRRERTVKELPPHIREWEIRRRGFIEASLRMDILKDKWKFSGRKEGKLTHVFCKKNGLPSKEGSQIPKN